MSDSPLQHMLRVFSGVEDVNEAELRRQLGEWVSVLSYSRIRPHIGP